MGLTWPRPLCSSGEVNCPHQSSSVGTGPPPCLASAVWDPMGSALGNCRQGCRCVTILSTGRRGRGYSGSCAPTPHTREAQGPTASLACALLCVGGPISHSVQRPAQQSPAWPGVKWPGSLTGPGCPGKCREGAPGLSQCNRGPWRLACGPGHRLGRIRLLCRPTQLARTPAGEVLPRSQQTFLWVGGQVGSARPRPSPPSQHRTEAKAAPGASSLEL